MCTAGQLDGMPELLSDGSGVHGPTQDKQAWSDKLERCGYFTKTSATRTGRKRSMLVAAT